MDVKVWHTDEPLLIDSLSVHAGEAQHTDWPLWGGSPVHP